MEECDILLHYLLIQIQSHLKFVVRRLLLIDSTTSGPVSDSALASHSVSVKTSPDQLIQVQIFLNPLSKNW